MRLVKTGSIRIRISLMVVAGIIAAAAIYCLTDQILYRCHKRELESCARLYVQQVVKLNTYPPALQAQSWDVIAAKKEQEMKGLCEDFKLPQSQTRFLVDGMRDLVLGMKNNKARLFRCQISDVTLASWKLPWESDCKVRVGYKIELQYDKEADYFDGSVFGTVADQEGGDTLTNYCILTLDMRFRNHAAEITRTSMVNADTKDGLNENA